MTSSMLLKQNRVWLNSIKNEPKAYQKALKLIEELHDHPKTGTGKPKQLTGDTAPVFIMA